MTLARILPHPQQHLRLVEPEEETQLAQRINTSHLEDRIDWMREIIAKKVSYDHGICNLRTYERINDCYDLIEEIASVPMRRLYQEHGASTGRIGEIRFFLLLLSKL